MTRSPSSGRVSGPMIAVLIGLTGGIALLALTRSNLDFGQPKIDRRGSVEISINGLNTRMARDVLLPTHGWILQIHFPNHSRGEAEAGLDVQLRAERTGATIQIEDQLVFADGFASFSVPKSLGLDEGLLSVRAILTDSDGRQFGDDRRIRIRRSLGGAPIGHRQVILFDFTVDRDGDGTADFQADLERFGLATAGQPMLAQALARRIEAHAIARVEQAYDPIDDPNLTQRPRDPVGVRFRPTTDPGALVTRICVGGTDPTHSGSVGHVRFDRSNENKFSVECGDEPIAGLFPSELEIYQDAPLYRQVFGPFLKSLGGTAIGAHPADVSLLVDSPVDPPASAERSARMNDIDRAVRVLGEVLGSIMAHEAGHALGLVAPGKPGSGLFGGSEGDAYAHNLDEFGRVETQPELMNPGRSLRFEDLAGESGGGPLRFRALNYAYLRDRVVLSDEH